MNQLPLQLPETTIIDRNEPPGTGDASQPGSNNFKRGILSTAVRWRKRKVERRNYRGAWIFRC
jgi:hypothetical protein